MIFSNASCKKTTTSKGTVVAFLVFNENEKKRNKRRNIKRKQTKALNKDKKQKCHEQNIQCVNCKINSEETVLIQFRNVC